MTGDYIFIKRSIALDWVTDIGESNQGTHNGLLLDRPDSVVNNIFKTLDEYQPYIDKRGS